MTRRALDARELDPATRARLGLDAPEGQGTRQEINEQLQQRRRQRGDRNEAAIAKQRVHTGRAFEEDLAITHQQYVFQKWGKSGRTRRRSCA